MLPFQVLKVRLLYLLFCCIVIEIKAQNFDLEQKISYEATSVTLHETLKTLKEITGIAYAYNNAGVFRSSDANFDVIIFVCSHKGKGKWQHVCNIIQNKTQKKEKLDHAGQAGELLN